MLVGKMWSHHDSIDKANRKVAIMGAYWIFKDGTHNAGMMVVPGSWALEQNVGGREVEPP